MSPPPPHSFPPDTHQPILDQASARLSHRHGASRSGQISHSPLSPPPPHISHRSSPADEHTLTPFFRLAWALLTDFCRTKVSTRNLLSRVSSRSPNPNRNPCEELGLGLELVHFGRQRLLFLGLFRRGRTMATLALILLLQSAVNGMGDLWQVPTREPEPPPPPPPPPSPDPSVSPFPELAPPGAGPRAARVGSCRMRPLRRTRRARVDGGPHYSRGRSVSLAHIELTHQMRPMRQAETGTPSFCFCSRRRRRSHSLALASK